MTFIKEMQTIVDALTSHGQECDGNGNCKDALVHKNDVKKAISQVVQNTVEEIERRVESERHTLSSETIELLGTIAPIAQAETHAYNQALTDVQSLLKDIINEEKSNHERLGNRTTEKYDSFYDEFGYIGGNSCYRTGLAPCANGACKRCHPHFWDSLKLWHNLK